MMLVGFFARIFFTKLFSYLMLWGIRRWLTKSTRV